MQRAIALMLCLFLAQSAGAEAVTVGTPVAIVLQHLSHGERACVATPRSPSFFRARLEEGEKSIAHLEASGQLQWVDGHAHFTGGITREIKRMLSGSPFEPEGRSRNGLVALMFMGWLRDRADGRREIVSAADEEEIAAAVIEVLHAQRFHASRLRQRDLPAPLLLVRDRSGCNPIIHISELLENGDLAFVSTSVDSGSLSAWGDSWVLRREHGAWRIIGSRPDWVS